MLHAFLLFAQEKGQAAPEGPPLLSAFVPLIVIFVLFYFLLILPERRRERRTREDLNARMKKNDKVVTTSGIIAVIASIKDEEVTLRIDENSNARLTVLKASIARILSGDDQAKDAPARGTEEAIKAGAPPAK
jgi:preprotein translocase subunit YajC